METNRRQGAYLNCRFKAYDGFQEQVKSNTNLKFVNELARQYMIIMQMKEIPLKITDKTWG